MSDLETMARECAEQLLEAFPIPTQREDGNDFIGHKYVLAELKQLARRYHAAKLREMAEGFAVQRDRVLAQAQDIHRRLGGDGLVTIKPRTDINEVVAKIHDAADEEEESSR